MTVAGIKEYIDEKLNKYKDKAENYFTPLDNYCKTLFEIKSMLDELEQPIEIDTKKYFKTMDKIIAKEIKRSKS